MGIGQSQSLSLKGTLNLVSNESEECIPETGAIFCYGQSIFTSNNPFGVKDETVILMASYCGHSVFICESGQVYVTGDNYCGQLGLGRVGTAVDVPTLVPVFKTKRIVQAACGDSFTLFLSTEGEVFACGENKDGQLGLGFKTDRSTPELVTGIPKVLQISAGYAHSVALTEGGEAWSWGGNGHGELGLGDTTKRTSPNRVTLLDAPIKHVSCGFVQTAFVTASGLVFKCGRNKSGELGVASGDTEGSSTPLLVPIERPVVAVACGEDHNVALTEDGDVWAWGANWHGQIGLSEKVDWSIPRRMPRIEGHKVVQIAAECSQTALVTDDGSLFTLGNDEYGQLCHGEGRNDLDTPKRVVSLAHLFVKQVTCGTTYTLVLAKPRSEENVLVIKGKELIKKEVEQKQQTNEREKRMNVREHRLNEWEQRMSDRELRMNDREERMDVRERRLDENERKTGDVDPLAANREMRMSVRKKKKKGTEHYVI